MGFRLGWASGDSEEPLKVPCRGGTCSRWTEGRDERQDEHWMSEGFGAIMKPRMETSGCNRTVVHTGVDSWDSDEQGGNKSQTT